MTARGITFTAPMVRAILDGRKTQTRRIIKPQPIHSNLAPHSWCGTEGPCALCGDDDGNPVRRQFGEPGDRIKVPATRTMRSFKGRTVGPVELEIVDVGVERLKSISAPDAIAEGLKILSKDNGVTWKYGIPDLDGLPGKDDYGWHWQDWEVDPRKAFRRLWEQIHGAGEWEKNPWVWKIEFKRVEL